MTNEQLQTIKQIDASPEFVHSCIPDEWKQVNNFKGTVTYLHKRKDGEGFVRLAAARIGPKGRISRMVLASRD